jgi:hypothetical protein
MAIRGCGYDGNQELIVDYSPGLKIINIDIDIDIDEMKLKKKCLAKRRNIAFLTILLTSTKQRI